MFNDVIETPIGQLLLIADEQYLLAAEFIEKDCNIDLKPNRITRLAANEFLEYFSGQRKQFSTPLNARGTEFQHSVWQQLLNIGYGDVCSYSDIALKVNNPKAVRAVGAANGKNPSAIIVPCHRVIGKSGRLTGYAGGLNRKTWLLDHEMKYR